MGFFPAGRAEFVATGNSSTATMVGMEDGDAEEDEEFVDVVDFGEVGGGSSCIIGKIFLRPDSTFTVGDSEGHCLETAA